MGSRTSILTRGLVMAVLGGSLPVAAASAAESGGDAAALAKSLANPVAALISVPLQFNYDQDIGPADRGDRWSLNLQPVVPIDLGEDWNLISRTILPVVYQSDVLDGAGSQAGIGDLLQSTFFSPKAPTSGGWIWGAGPAVLLPTGSDDLLTTDKWAIGPTAVLLRQQGRWTYGGLANHLVSIAGKSDRDDIKSTFLQPFVNYTTPTAWSFVVNIEGTRDWEAGEWSVPVNLLVTKVTRVGNQLVSVGGGMRYWLDSPESGPEGIGFRIVITLLYPR